ncbi:BnaA02g25260D [Brassica napus]|uniref:(rape) hypothetical protein n=1 Tax=Brassica napus TaxID=3708 RepID=A0A078GQY0_BRANA|nr:unnamed protein product [Brassica napus]CDY28950.1 BnaA02g25260D [Brassica napus]
MVCSYISVVFLFTEHIAGDTYIIKRKRERRPDTKTKRGTLFVMTQLASSSPKPIYVSIKILAQFI